MAADSPILTRQRVLAFAAEATTGTGATLNATQGGLTNAYDSKIKYDIKANERKGQGSGSPLNPVPGARSGKCTFSSELFGSGTAATAPGWGILLLACGMQLNTAIYTPLTAAIETLTMGVYYGSGTTARLKTIVGAMGDVKIKGSTGNPVMLEWDFLGVHAAPTTVTIITPTYPTTIPPRFAGGTLTVGGTAYRIGEIEIAFNNKLTLRKDAAQSTGYHAAYVVERRIIVKINPEALPLSSEDWYAAHVAGTTFALSLTVGSVAGNEFTIAAPVMQLLNPPDDKDEDEILHDDLEFLCVRNSSAGDDEFSITCV